MCFKCLKFILSLIHNIIIHKYIIFVRTDGLTAEDRSQLDHAGVLRIVRFREPFPGDLSQWQGKSCWIENGCLKKHSWTTIGSTSRLIPLPGVSRLS